ncbi:hypothetical protein Baya_13410 [Bagarius yarrelli]|uniref:Uncharacterized protein n=1 Tax=Bagarius yarrelli TaxID=175774 RepID=A0A556V5I0_BAGYA|nr:hypothetical protein Baya_13410 [Bagarius yarrelli]
MVSFLGKGTSIEPGISKPKEKQSMNALGQPEPDDRVKELPNHQIGGFWASVTPSLCEHLERLPPCCHDNGCYNRPADYCSDLRS